MPGSSNPNSLATTKHNVGLGYGDAALIAQQIIRCLEYELSLRDAELANLRAVQAGLKARLEALEARAS